MNDFKNYHLNNEQQNDKDVHGIHNQKNKKKFGAFTSSSAYSAYYDDNTDIENNINQHNNESNAVKNFGFGVYLSYWNDEKQFFNIVKPKYETLKQELTTNIIYKLTNQQYYDTFNKAHLWQKTITINAKNIGRQNKQFNIFPGEILTINHLISLMVYCNYTAMQYEFKRFVVYLCYTINIT